MTITDYEHQRRGTKNNDFKISERNIKHQKQEAFLSNSENKEKLGGLLTKSLREENHAVINYLKDAETRITPQAIETAKVQKTVK